MTDNGRPSHGGSRATSVHSCSPIRSPTPIHRSPTPSRSRSPIRAPTAIHRSPTPAHAPAPIHSHALPWAEIKAWVYAWLNDDDGDVSDMAVPPTPPEMSFPISVFNPAVPSTPGTALDYPC